MTNARLVALVGLVAVLGSTVGLVNAFHPSWSPRFGGWLDMGAPPSNSVAKLTVALKLRNVGELEAFVAKVSDPNHKEYGMYMTREQIADLTGPSDSAVDAVASYFHSIGATTVTPTFAKDFLVVEIPHDDLARAVSSDFKLFKHMASGRETIRTPRPVSLNWPESVSQHVQLVTGLDDFPDMPSERKALTTFSRDAKLLTSTTNAPQITRVAGNEVTAVSTLVLYCTDGNALASATGACSSGPDVTSVSLIYMPRAHPAIVTAYKIGALTARAGIPMNFLTPVVDIPRYARLNVSAVVTYSDGTTSTTGVFPTTYSPSPWVTPRSIHAAYGIPVGMRGTNPNNSVSIASFEKQYISVDGDLRTFYHDVGLPFENPKIVGPNDPSSPGVESSLDIQYASGVGAGVPPTVWSVASGGYVLEWAMQVNNVSDPPLVTSISYGDTEHAYFNKFGSWDYIHRMNSELAKMAARGQTVAAGAGDAGVSNVGEMGNDLSPADPTCTPFRPFYPSNSPYVLSVGSTFFTTDALPVCQRSMSGSPLPVSCTEVGEMVVSVTGGMGWTTGGGFSNLTATQPWQKDAVSAYFAAMGSDIPPTSNYNMSGRGYPDVAVVGHNYLIEWGGNLMPVDGTSASGPTTAGVISLLNDIRLNAGKPPLGLVTPWLYQMAAKVPGSFNDVVVGENADGDMQPRGSKYATFCPYGFKAAPGWDPASGLGSFNFDVLSKHVLDM